MFVPRQTTVRPARGRRGAILVVVLGLLTLFAVLGVAFVYTSSAESDAARIFKDRENTNALVPPDATAAVQSFLQSLIYPVGDTNTDALNVLRGHELLRSMYGGRGSNNVPYNGIGTFHEDMRLYGVPAFLSAVYATPLDRAHAINHTLMHMGTNGLPSNLPWQFLLDPEKIQAREVPDPNTGGIGTFNSSTRATVSKAAPYTYADLKDLYLGVVSPTGEVVVPSFHRTWLFNAKNPNVAYRLAPWNPNDGPPVVATSTTLTALNTDWVTAEGRLRILRPRPVDQLTTAELQGVGFYPLPTEPQLALMPLATRQGLYNLIRNNIAAGFILGYPQQNVDGTFSGDHINHPGTNGKNAADSLILDTGMQLIQLSNGRFAKPVVSVLVTDMNGKVNPSVHGNLQYQPPAQPGNPPPPLEHNSYHGLGAHEVNLGRVVGTAEARAIVNDRSATKMYQTRAGVNARYYDTSATRMPAASPVNWQVNGLTTAPTLPTGATAFQTVPTYIAPFEDNSTPASRHPFLANPAEWPDNRTANSLKTFSPTNLRRMAMQFAPPLLDYANLTIPGITVPAPGNNYRLSSTHLVLGALTPRSTSLDRPGLMPNYTNVNSGQSLQLQANSFHNPIYPTGYIAAAPSPSGGTTTADFDLTPSGINWQNTRSVVGPVDINRRVADYRDPGLPTNTPTLGPLGPTTISPLSFNQASMERQNLARDIFIRLVVASGAWVTFDASRNPTVTADPTANPNEFNAVRYLAQLAVNIVDYIDPDDISTPFIWRPTSGALTALTNADTVDPSGYTGVLSSHLSATDMGDRVVFGVEKPKLVINEVYSEVSNSPGDSGQGMGQGMGNANGQAQVKFWVELVNPTNAPYASAPNGPQGNGNATLRDQTNGYSPYRLVITRAAKGGSNAGDYLRVPTTTGFQSNVKGDLPAGFTPDILFRFDSTDIVLNAAKQVVAPNTGTYSGMGATQGIAVVGPQPRPMGQFFQGVQFNPDTTAAPWNGMLLGDGVGGGGGSSNTMEYELALPNNGQAFINTLRRHVVVLRRLANPYQPESTTNPYISVDVVDNVPSHDALHKLNGNPNPRGNANGLGNGNGYDPLTERFACGKIAPYSSYSQTVAAGGMAASYIPTMTQFSTTFSAILQQDQQPPPGAEPKHTFFRHNGRNTTAPANTYTPPSGMTPHSLSDTVLVPFDWFVHFDRPLTNQLELLHMHAARPHLVTELAMRPPTAATNPIDRSVGLAPWLASTSNGLYRAFDLLRVQDRTYGTPAGGKVHGRININTVIHPSVLEALFDSQAGNVFSATDVYDASNTTDDLWRRLVCPPISTMTGLPAPISGRVYRTANVVQMSQTNPAAPLAQVPVPGPTVHDFDLTYFSTNAAAAAAFPSLTTAPGVILDRPFLSLGAAQFAAPATSTSLAFAAPAGMGLQDTLLRIDNSTGQATSGVPAINIPAGQHAYYQAEAARKVLTNITTTSETFAVTFTVAFHEVRSDAAGNPATDAFGRHLIGREIYKEIAGDFRQQFFTVIDRANAATDANNNANVTGTPYFTTLEAAFTPDTTSVPLPTTSTIDIAGVDTSGTGAGPFVVYADGQPVTIAANSIMGIGVGANAESNSVTVSSVVASGTTGVLRVVVTPALQKPHAIGTCVSNASPGMPTNAPSFVMPNNDARFQGIVPYVTRIR